ncbi:MAG: PrsW family intramembrane metalloprotease [Eubacterium sp.]|nr:PrsW family intramembrane metalloprotease [Eubacterium sp.]
MTVFLALSCLPSIVLLSYIYKKDKADKEPFGLLLTLFVLGALVCFPVAFIESVMENINPFAQGSLLYNVFSNFLGVALIEEGGKFIVLYLVTHKNKNFNCLFDGVIYSVVTSLGFATLENILYVAQYGFATAVIRAVTAVPGHMFFGVLMGCFYTMWHLGKSLTDTEKQYHSLGYIDEPVKDKNSIAYKSQLLSALTAPVLVHGMYDLLATYSGVVAIILFIVLLVSLYIYCFGKVKKISGQDNTEANIIAGILNKRYPYLYPRIAQAMQRQRMQYNPFSQRSYNPYSAQNDYSYSYNPSDNSGVKEN